MALLWERIKDDSLSYHASTRRYMEMFAKYNGWDDPEAFERNKETKITFRIGECHECKKAGRETQKEKWEREGGVNDWDTLNPILG